MISLNYQKLKLNLYNFLNKLKFFSCTYFKLSHWQVVVVDIAESTTYLSLLSFSLLPFFWCAIKLWRLWKGTYICIHLCNGVCIQKHIHIYFKLLYKCVNSFVRLYINGLFIQYDFIPYSHLIFFSFHYDFIYIFFAFNSNAL